MESALNVTTSTLSLTVADVDASRAFFCTHLGYRVTAAADGFASSPVGMPPPTSCSSAAGARCSRPSSATGGQRA